MENENNEKKERSGCLTAFLIVFIVLYALGILVSLGSAAMSNSSFIQNNAALKKVYENVPSWSYACTVILDIINIVALVLVMNWKKIGVYLFIGAAVVSFVVSVVISTTTVSTIITGLVEYAVIFGIFYYVVHPVWKNLD